MNIFKKTLGTNLVKHEEEFYIVKGRDVYKINEVGARIFDLCDGKNDSDSICNTLAKFFSVSIEEINQDVLDYLNNLKALMLIKQAN